MVEFFWPKVLHYKANKNITRTYLRIALKSRWKRIRNFALVSSVYICCCCCCSCGCCRCRATWYVKLRSTIIMWMRAKSSTLGSLLIKLCIPHPLLAMALCGNGTSDLYRYSPINIVSFGVNDVLFSSSNRKYAQSVLHTHTPTLVCLADGSTPYYVMLLILFFFSLSSYFPVCSAADLYMKQVTGWPSEWMSEYFFLFTTKCYDNFRFHF